MFVSFKELNKCLIFPFICFQTTITIILALSWWSSMKQDTMSQLSYCNSNFQHGEAHSRHSNICYKEWMESLKWILNYHSCYFNSASGDYASIQNPQAVVLNKQNKNQFASHVTSMGFSWAFTLKKGTSWYHSQDKFRSTTTSRFNGSSISSTCWYVSLIYWDL